MGAAMMQVFRVPGTAATEPAGAARPADAKDPGSWTITHAMPTSYRERS